MKFVATALFLFVFAYTPIAKAQTQTEMNVSAHQSVLEKEAELEELYEDILLQYRDNAVFIDKMKKSHDAWLLFHMS